MNLGDRGRQVFKLNEHLIYTRYCAKFFIAAFVESLYANETIHAFASEGLSCRESVCKCAKCPGLNIGVRTRTRISASEVHSTKPKH